MSCGIPALCVAETLRFLRRGRDAARQPASAPRPRSPAHIKVIVNTCTLYSIIALLGMTDFNKWNSRSLTGTSYILCKILRWWWGDEMAAGGKVIKWRFRGKMKKNKKKGERFHKNVEKGLTNAFGIQNVKRAFFIFISADTMKIGHKTSWTYFTCCIWIVQLAITYSKAQNIR